MVDDDSRLRELITVGREARNREYKGTRGRESFAWNRYAVKAQIARAAMGMANIGGGSIVIGMDEPGAGDDLWEPNGIEPVVETTYKQDEVQQFVNQFADPYVELTVHHHHYDGKRFIIVEVQGFRDMPVVCTQGSAPLRPGAVYTRSYEKHETAEVRSQLEMREMLDRAISVGVQQRLEPIFVALRAAGLMAGAVSTDEDQFQAQRGDV